MREAARGLVRLEGAGWDHYSRLGFAESLARSLELHPARRLRIPFLHPHHPLSLLIPRLPPCTLLILSTALSLLVRMTSMQWRLRTTSPTSSSRAATTASARQVLRAPWGATESVEQTSRLSCANRHPWVYGYPSSCCTATRPAELTPWMMACMATCSRLHHAGYLMCVSFHSALYHHDDSLQCDVTPDGSCQQNVQTHPTSCCSTRLAEQAA